MSIIGRYIIISIKKNFSYPINAIMVILDTIVEKRQRKAMLYNNTSPFVILAFLFFGNPLKIYHGEIHQPPHL